MNKLSLIQQIQRFLKLESAGGILLLFSAVVAMLLANSPLNQTYNDFLNLPVSIQVGSFSIDKTLKFYCYTKAVPCKRPANRLLW